MEQTERHSIFLGQGDYPLKGMHFLLEAMGRLKESYPDLKLYVAGNSIISHETAKDKCKLSAYGKYLLVLIQLYELQDQVIVLGKLSAEEMKAQFLRSSVFVCPSVMEKFSQYDWRGDASWGAGGSVPDGRDSEHGRGLRDGTSVS